MEPRRRRSTSEFLSSLAVACAIAFACPFVIDRLGGLEAIAGWKDCPIKGNVSVNGHIYHLPHHEHYRATRIDILKGERWFCSERDAQAAGWRRAKR